MIPKHIHQIYWNYRGVELSQRKLFLESKSRLDNLEGFQYTIWDQKSCDTLVHSLYPQYESFYKDLRFVIQKIDFVRFLILHAYGGIYVDMDMLLIGDLNSLIETNHSLHFSNIKEVFPNYHYIENEFMASIKHHDFWIYACDYSMKEYRLKQSIEIYKQWKGRFVIRTTGPGMLTKAYKAFKPIDSIVHEKLSYTDKHKEKGLQIQDGYIFMNHKSNTWIKKEVI